jgi:glucose-6-phosphate 1-dehydrogenase
MMNDFMEKENRVAETVIEGVAEDLKRTEGGCIMDGTIEPCTLVIIGASGDLTARKLVPSLFNLYLNKGLPKPFLILGCSRTKMTDEAFRESMKDALAQNARIDQETWGAFAEALFYRPIQYDDPSSYADLAEYLRSLDREYGTKGNRIFYLAIPPGLYETTARMLGRAGLSEEREGWSRIVVEKPFGRDLKTAIALDSVLDEHFEEHQIFRIDHYLAKETVQNILMLRFANAIFEPLWNRQYIDHVSIMASETLGVERRAGYYEKTGVLRDMFQNHMMQLLALTAMEPPSLFEADRVRDEKAKLYRSLRPFPTESLQEYLVLGQYGSGRIGGKAVPAYREEQNVSPDSLTPTFAMMKIFMDNWRWQGVPFYLGSGKRLAEKRTEILIQFKEIPHSMFREVLGEDIRANRLTLGIYPEEKITLTFQTKNPGAKVCLRSVTMDFHYHQGYEGPALDAYEKVLLDVMMGDHMLFWRQDGVELCWSFLTPILEECETCGNREQMLLTYEAGSRGPEAVENLRHGIPTF